MTSHLTLGKNGEAVAAAHLRARGYRILAYNVRTARGEIDLIAREEDVIVFIEVKARDRDDGFSPLLRVDPAKIRRLQGAATLWLEGQSMRGVDDIAARIDVLGVCAGRVVEHLEDVAW